MAKKQKQPEQAAAINIDELTLRDLCDIEEATGVSMGDVNLDSPPMKVVAGLIWVVRRQEDPDYTLDDVLNLPVAELERLQEQLQGNA